MTDRNTPEKETLSRYLDTYRDIIVFKAEGVSRAEAVRPMVPSGTSLLGIVKHMSYVERWWFHTVLGGRTVEPLGDERDPGAEWRVEEDETVEGIIGHYRSQCEESRAILDGLESLDTLFEVRDEHISARRVVIHMLEETARHAGHADILRELIDGSTGWGP